MDWKSMLPAGMHKPGALTAGLSIFLTLVYVLNWVFPINKSILLDPGALAKLQLTRLSLYPLAHLSFLHLLFNLVSLFVPLSLFEASHGTVFTGITLNLLAIVTGIIYCVVGMLLYPNVYVGGASGWCFSLCGYFAVQEAGVRPHYQLSSLKIPTLYMPLVFLLVVSLIVPGTSFVGHLIGLGLGYLIGFRERWLQVLVPPSWLIVKIETWLDRWISMIPSVVKYHRESTVDRTAGYAPLYQESELPLHNDNFPGQGRVLGP
ncbi:AaceriAFL155Cp [[Ashbya] aceris (nom. inval.)]|nr:AaceriAFL155Cp [[Ashbya] aceris (nom. inval.)]